MLKNFIIILLFALNYNIQTQTLVNIRAELTPEVYQEWDNYIRKYAPADSAFNVMAALVQRHYISGRSGVCMLVLDMYSSLFPNKDSIIKVSRNLHEQLMLSQTPNPDMLNLYNKYIIENAPSRNALFAVHRIADTFIKRKDWDSTAYIFNYFKKYFPEQSNYFESVLNIINQPEEGLVLRNLGAKLNSRQAEWDPNPTPDGRYLYFTASFKNGGYGNADIWVSEMKKGEWQAPVNLGTAINGRKQETIDNVTADGTGLLLSGDFSGTFGQFDIFYAAKTDSSWESLLHYSMPINTKYVDESANISSDGRVMIFTSDRPGGVGEYHPYGSYHGGTEMGNMDLYYSILENGEWSEPRNLGSVINTPYSERSVFLHPDGKTIYFSSNGHPGLGRLDVFKSTRLNDTSWTEWSVPVNLGKEINSEEDDWGYKISFKGDSAFFAARNRQIGFGDWDLYSVTLPENAKPEKLIAVRGQVFDSKNRPLSADIIWEDLESGETIGKLKSDPRDGSYFIALKYGRKYGYYANKNGYYPESNNIDLKNHSEDNDIYKNIKLVSLSELRDSAAKITINNIFFDFGKYELKQESFLELNRLADFLKINKKYKVIVEGHTDNIGTKTTNQELSEKRAAAVAQYLISKGFDRDIFEIIGHGAENPVADNNTEKNRALNRRVEISFKKR